MTKLISLFSIIWVALLLFTSPVLAQDATNSATQSASVIEVKYASINPTDQSKFAFKRLKEKVVLVLLTFMPAKKLDYQLSLVNERLAELKYIVDHKDITNIETVSERYFTTAGQTTAYANAKKLDQQKPKIIETLTQHLGVLEQLKSTYDMGTAEWRFLEHDSDYLKTYIKDISP